MKGMSRIDTALLKADLEKFAEIYCTTVQQMAIEEATTLAKMAMESYYGAYDPFYYIPRTNQMKDKSFQPYKEVVGSEYRGGIKINPTFTSHDPRGVSEDYIYHYVWEEGIHGFESFRKKNQGKRTPIYGKKEPKNRYEEINKELHKPKKKREINDKAMAIAKQGSYMMLHF